MKVGDCEDCGLEYKNFGLDTTLTNEQWLMIHPESTEGILCANCIVKRASYFRKVICAKMILTTTDNMELFKGDSSA